MRNLDKINCAAKSTASIFSISLILPIFVGWSSWALAVGAAPALALRDNYVALFGLGVCVISFLLLPIPFAFKWDWRTSHYGAALFGIGSLAWMGISPLLCLISLGHMAWIFRIVILIGYLVTTIAWCYKFIKIYRVIYTNSALFNTIYLEERNEVYFLQQGDRQVLTKVFKFSQFPPDWTFLLSFSIATALAFFRSEIVSFVGVPFLHIFLAVSAIPVSLAFLGLATKMWLVFYTYPRKIKALVGKTTYVDMASQPKKLPVVPR